jgi:hypothetical protein
VKRLLLALLLIAAPASAKTLIVPDPSSSSSVYATEQEVIKYQVLVLRRILDRYGATYTVASPKLMKTEFLRTGTITHNFGKAGAYNESFDAVIYVGNHVGNGIAGAGGCRVDSMTLSRGGKLPTIPMLVLLNQEPSLVGGTQLDFGDISSDSLGVAEHYGPGEGTGAHDGEGCMYQPGYPDRAFDPAQTSSCRLHYLKDGGTRCLVAWAENSILNTTERSFAVTGFPDSIGFKAAPDTAMAWVLMNKHVAGAKPMVVCSAVGQGGTDSLGVVNGALANINFPALMVSLAYLDSLAGGRVFDGNRTVKAAVVFDGAFRRAGRAHPYGLFAADSATYKASIDSLASLNTPFTVAVNPDSIAANVAETAWWKRAALAHFIPVNATALDDTTKASGATSASTPIDPWGRYRKRIAYGDGSRTGADTSLWAGIVSNRAKVADQFGRDKVSSAAMPYASDWSPLTMLPMGGGPPPDSVFYAALSAGVTTIVFDARGRDWNQQYLRTNPTGYVGTEGYVPVTLSGAPASQLKLLAYFGGTTLGSTRFLATTTDTIPPTCDVSCAGTFPAAQEQGKAWESLFAYDGAFPRDGFGGVGQGVFYDAKDILYPKSQASVIRIGVGLLGSGGTALTGMPGVTQTQPTRQGWLVFKHLVHVARMVNRFGKTLLTFDYPENCEP